MSPQDYKWLRLRATNEMPVLHKNNLRVATPLENHTEVHIFINTRLLRIVVWSEEAQYSGEDWGIYRDYVKRMPYTSSEVIIVNRQNVFYLFHYDNRSMIMT